MGLFSKLFKGDNADGAPVTPPPPQPPPRRERAEAPPEEPAQASPAQVSDDALTTEMPVMRGTSDTAANANATEELVLPSELQSLPAVAAPPPPPPPPPPPIAAKHAVPSRPSPLPPVAPPPVGGARDTDSARALTAARTRTPSGTLGAAVGKAPAKGLTAANKALAAAHAARKVNTPIPPPPLAAGAVPAEPQVRRSKAETIRGFVAPVFVAEPNVVVSAVVTTPVETPAPALRGGGSAAELDQAVDAAVDGLLDQVAAEKDAAAAEAERAAVRRAAAVTFHSFVAANAAPVRELMFQLSVGRTPRKWAASCRSVLAPLLAGARQIELNELSNAFAQLDLALELAAAETSAYIGAENGAVISTAYAQLTGLLPQAFTALQERDGRRLLLLESLLLQVPAMNRRMLGKLYGAGLSSLDHLSGAAADEISIVAGIDRKVAAALSAHLERFERERDRLDPVDARSHVHERLRSVLARLRAVQEEFEQAEADEAAERKRAARRAREITTLELDVLLLEIGELALTDELKRHAVRHRIQRLESYLEHAQASA